MILKIISETAPFNIIKLQVINDIADTSSLTI